MNLIFIRKMRFISVLLVVFMVFGLFPATVFAAGQEDENDAGEVIDLILAILNNEDYAGDLAELKDRLEGITPHHLDFLLEKMEMLISARNSIVPEKTKEKLLAYGIDSDTVEEFLDAVFYKEDAVFGGDEFQRFIDILTTLLGKQNVTLDDMDDLLDYYHGLDAAFTEKFPDAVGAGKDKLKTYDLVALSTAFFRLFSEPIDPFALTPENKVFINGVIDALPGDVKEKLVLYGIDWEAYDTAIETALDEGLITDDDIATIRSILGLSAPVLAPTASLEEGIYYNDVSVMLGTLTAGADIYYTTNGNDPVVTPSQKYSGAITISRTTTIKAMAVKDDQSSEIKTFVYTIKTATPTASPRPGTYSKEDYQSINVSLSSITSGANIYYTTNGNTPTTSSSRYSAPINISEDTVIKAIAVKNGVSSQVASFSYKFVVKEIAISDDYAVDQDGTADIDIPDIPLGNDGKTQPVFSGNSCILCVKPGSGASCGILLGHYNSSLRLRGRSGFCGDQKGGIVR